MRVKNCEDCNFYQRRTWTQRYTASSGKTVGCIHAYGWCCWHKSRVAEVKSCDKKEARWF